MQQIQEKCHKQNCDVFIALPAALVRNVVGNILVGEVFIFFISCKVVNKLESHYAAALQVAVGQG